MRFEGTLKSWNEDRGFGFITPRQGGDEIFVHIKAFPRNSGRPREGEVLHFEVETTREGKKRALRVSRPESVFEHASTHPERHHARKPKQESHSIVEYVIMLAILGGIGWYIYGRMNPVISAAPGDASEPKVQKIGSLCDGRIYCSQMTSCREAKYFLRNCPGVQMDGNNNGTPCEQQWCTWLGAR